MDVIPLKIKMIQTLGKQIFMEKAFFVVELEASSNSERHLLKVSSDLVSNISYEDLQGVFSW
jgi:hypothetical protein